MGRRQGSRASATISLGIMRTVRRIQALAADTGAAVWFGHDIEQFASVRKATQGEGHYE